MAILVQDVRQCANQRCVCIHEVRIRVDAFIAIRTVVFIVYVFHSVWFTAFGGGMEKRFEIRK